MGALAKISEAAMRTKEQLGQQFREIIAKIEASNPYDTFEPLTHEEGKFDIWELYEARLNKLLVERIQQLDDKELTRYWLGLIADEIAREH
jgi:hypothetical protein